MNSIRDWFENKKKVKKLIRILSILIFTGAIVSVIMIVSLSYSMKKNQVNLTMKALSSSSSGVIAEFIEPVITLLKTMSAWDKSGEINIDNIEDIALKLVPFLENEPMLKIAGVRISKIEKSLYIYNKNGSWMLKHIASGKAVIYDIIDGKIFEVKKEPDDHKFKKSKILVNISDSDKISNDIIWSAPYLFPEYNQFGVSASIRSSQDEDLKTNYRIITCDLLLSDMKEALDSVFKLKEGSLFLISEKGKINHVATVFKNDEGKEVTRYSSNKSPWISDTTRQAFAREFRKAPVDDDLVFSFIENKKKWWGSISSNITDTVMTRLCIAMPESVLLEGVKPVRYLIFIVAFSVLAITSLILLFVARRFSKKIENIPVKKEYIKASEEELLKLIDEGESEFLEFKSTLRMNLKSGNKGKEIELASLKTIVAFMNSNGGVLLIGVADDGTVTGIGPDGFENDDRALLHFNSLFSNHIGLKFSGYISFDVRVVDGNKIIVAECRKSDEPVFLNNKDSEDFYVRVGPGSRKLLTSEVIEYLKNR